MTTGDLLKKTRLTKSAAQKSRLDEEIKLKESPESELSLKVDEDDFPLSENPTSPANEQMQHVELDDRYDVLAVIGTGGMGTVYKVLDKTTKRTLAVKVLQPDLSNDQTALRRFEQEAEAAAQLNHPNLVSVLSYGKTKNGAPYLVMDYFEGESLSAILKKETALDSGRALALFHQICEGLAHAHAQGVIHRDIKPANIIVSRTESGEVARVVDFGIAKILPVSNRETHNLTETRQVFGSPHYMSPEHCLGFKMDERSDIYSLGCLMYEALTGNPPFAVNDAIQAVIKHINEEAKEF